VSETAFESVRAGVDVMAGVLPGQPEEVFTRRWFLTSTEWHSAESNDGQLDLLSDLSGKAMAYAVLLMQQPNRLNWVKVEWVWY
jgi:hypothetical protein